MFREPLATAKTTVGGVEVPRTEILGYAVGGRTSGFDLVRRHAYEVGAQVFTSGGRGEGDVSYEYRGLGNPTIGVTASQTWDDDGVRVRRPATGAEGSPATFFVLERERRLATSVRVHRPGVRMSTSLRFSAGLVRSDREVLDKALRSTDGFRLTRPGSLLATRRTTPLPVCRKRPFTTHADRLRSNPTIPVTVVFGRQRPAVNWPAYRPR